MTEQMDVGDQDAGRQTAASSFGQVSPSIERGDSVPTGRVSTSLRTVVALLFRGDDEPVIVQSAKAFTSVPL